MPFTDKFVINSNLIPKPSKRRSGQMAGSIRFIVAHDTGNKNSTAAQNVKFYINSRNEKSASAHLFVDDKEIIECVPALTASPEKAWHVLYGVPKDNELYGVNANDAAIGVEYCYGDNIDADKAYTKYVWLLAKLCFVFGLDPSKDITGHFFLDPKRKTDPVTGLAHSRRTYEGLLRDVVKEYNECSSGTTLLPVMDIVQKSGTASSTVKLNIRRQPNTTSEIVQTVAARTALAYKAAVQNGQRVNNNPVWYQDVNDHYFWSGGVLIDAAGNSTAPAAGSNIAATPVTGNNTKANAPVPASVPKNLPLTQSQCIRTAEWMNLHFGAKCEAVVADTPFTKDLLYAIACQETAIYFQRWIDDFTPDEVLGRCVFDASGDVNGTRSAFPKNTAAFIAKFGNQMANALIEEANKTRALRGFSPRQWVYAGYGIFQYDLQHILTDEAFFTNKLWYNIDDCLNRAMKELKSKWAAHPNDLFNTVRSYNGSGPRAENYANNVFQFLAWIRAVV